MVNADPLKSHVDRLPTGTVTFLFTDIEGSTALLQRLGADYPPLLSEHHRILLEAVRSNEGVRVQTEGDAVFAVFASAAQALNAAIQAQRALARHPWPDGAAIKVRMGLHTGEGRLSDGDYVGIDVHRAARIAAASHGGQIVVSEATKTLAAGSLSDVNFQDLGKHRLKDLIDSERLYQACVAGLPTRFPALRTLHARAHNLPEQLTTFVGREREVIRIRELLAKHRLVTLTGPGGTGKTRLSLQVAAESLEGFSDGAYFVPLASITDAALVPASIADALGVRASDEGPVAELLTAFLGDRELLLVLDNLEQVIEAAPIVSDLLAAAPRLRVIVTSREILRVSGEQEFQVPPLSFPRADGTALRADMIAGHEAVRLFVQRAQQVRPDFALNDENASAVAEICGRLEGLPLAIELAAARLRLFSPAELRDRLQSQLDVLRGGPRDRPARHQALRNTIEWSYGLLDDLERTLFCVVSIFSPARVDSVQGVADRLELLMGVDVIDLLASLVDKSLLRRVEENGRPQLSMLESIREYAAEKLNEQAEFRDAATRAHAEYFLEFASSRRDLLRGADRTAALDDLASEVENLLTTWRFCVHARDIQKLDDLLNVLWVLHEARGWYHGAARLTKDVLDVLSTVPPTTERARDEIKLRTGLARALMAVRGMTDEVEEIYNHAISQLKDAEVSRQFPVLRSLASFHLYRGEFDLAAVLGKQLLELAEEHGDPGIKVEALTVYGANTAFIGDIPKGLEYLDEAIELFTRAGAAGEPFRLGPSAGVVPFTTSAFLLWLTGHPDRARRRAAEGLEVAKQLNHPYTLAYARFHVGLLELWHQQVQNTLEHAAAVLEIAEEHDYEVWKAVGCVLQGAATVFIGRAEEGLARIEAGISLYRHLKTPPVFWTALLLLRASALGYSGRPTQAMAVVDEALSLVPPGDMFEADLRILKGDLLLAMSDPQSASSEFRRAFEISEPLGVRMNELRAATRLARLHGGTAEGAQHSTTLRAVYERFTEGFEAPDLVDARRVLEETAPR